MGRYTCARIEYHADDFGLFPAQSERILDCCGGRLGGVSIFPNGEALEECAGMLRHCGSTLAVTIHLNLIEGPSLSAPAGPSPLTDGAGTLSCRFGSLLLRSYLPGRNRLRQAIAREFRAQIRRASAVLGDQLPLRLDSHAHYHMIPVVFDALMDVVREDALDVRYIRIPEENVGLYLRSWRRLEHFAPVNLAKVAILNVLAKRNRAKYRQELAAMEQKLFLGVFLSGRMTRRNVEAILPDAVALAQKRGWDLEILAHPGSVREPEDLDRVTSPNDLAFFTDPLREEEQAMLLSVSPAERAAVGSQSY